MANTYKLIASSTVGSGGAANIEFTSIPATYTDLCLKLSARASNAGNWEWIGVQFNNDTASNYSARYLYGIGSGSTASGSDSSTAIRVIYIDSNNATASTFSNTELYIPNYASSNYKSVSTDTVMENNSSTAIVSLNAGLWSSASAITSIKMTVQSATADFMQHSTAHLYGISNS